MDGSNKRYQVLALDGGGIRGIFSISFLERIEAELEADGKRLIDHFNVIVGTSTGAIIALGLAFGMKATEIREQYEELGEDVFPWLRRRLRKGVIFAKYRNDTLRVHLEEIFGERLLGSAEVPVCIPSVDTATFKPRVFKTPHSPRFHVDKNFRAVDVALASSAAPTYFPAAEVNGAHFIDGGLWGNNPSLVGVTELSSCEGAALKDIAVLNIGTGEPSGPQQGTRKQTGIRKGSLRKWGTDLVSCVMLTQSRYTENVLNQLLPKGHYFRVSTALPDEGSALDDVSLIEPLKVKADREFQQRWRKIEQQFFKRKPQMTGMQRYLEEHAEDVE